MSLNFFWQAVLWKTRWLEFSAKTCICIYVCICTRACLWHQLRVYFCYKQEDGKQDQLSVPQKQSCVSSLIPWEITPSPLLCLDKYKFAFKIMISIFNKNRAHSFPCWHICDIYIRKRIGTFGDFWPSTVSRDDTRWQCCCSLKPRVMLRQPCWSHMILI